MTTHNCRFSSRSVVHPPGYAPCTPSHKSPAIHSYPGLFSLLAWHLNLFFLNSPSLYQSISSLTYPLNDYFVTYHQRTPSSILSSTPFITAQLPYPCIWDSIYLPNTKQASEVVHLCSPNCRSLLLLPDLDKMPQLWVAIAIWSPWRVELSLAELQLKGHKGENLCFSSLS